MVSWFFPNMDSARIEKRQSSFSRVYEIYAIHDCTRTARKRTAIKTTDDEKALDYIAEYINKGVRVFGLHSRRFWYSKNLNLPKEYKQKYHTNFDIATDIRDVARNVLARNYGIISYNALGVKTKCVIDMGDLGKYMKVRILANIKPEKPIEKIKVESKRYSKRIMQEIAQAKPSFLRQVQGELVFD